MIQENSDKDGWIVTGSYPFDKQPVHVDANDLKGINIDGTHYQVLDRGDTYDIVLLLAVSKWRRQFGTTESVHPIVDTVFQGEHSRDPNELLRFCLNDHIAEVYNIVADEIYQTLRSGNESGIYDLLNQFAQTSDSFVLTAGTPYNSEQDDTHPHSTYLLGRHMYSVIAADSTNRTVMVADPHDTERKQFNMSYNSFTQQFRRLAGIRLE